MCGISGYYSIKDELSKENLEKMNHSLFHRGPDATGFYKENAIALSHNRLSIIDLSKQANQPMHSRCKRYVIVFNGEVYNFNELKEQYQLSLQTTSDTEVVLELFAKLRKNSISLFKGMFAAAIYDKETNELFLFRDRTGIKPLYYFYSESFFAFSSELKSLYTLSTIRNNLSINYRAISRYLHLGYIPEPDTIYNNMHKFPSGHYAVLSNNNPLQFNQFWNYTDHFKNEAYSTFESTKKRLSEILESSVRSHMISDVPFGTFLSGGTDSSLVSAIAAKQSSNRIKTFSIGFSESKYNESEYAKAVAKHINSHHFEFVVSPNEARKHIPTLFDHYDEPYTDSSAIPTFLVSKLARQEVKMVLSGDGGDELFMGYGAYNWAQRFSNSNYIKLLKLICPLLKINSDKYRRINFLLNTNGSNNIHSHIFSQEQNLFTERELKFLIPYYNNLDFCFKIPNQINNRTLTSQEKQAIFDLNYYLKDDLLVKVDRASMLNSLEVRVPLLDASVIEFALNIHQNLKIHNKTEKYILKSILYDYIPSSLFNRPKWGFSIPLKEWLSNELNYLIDDYLSPELIKSFNLLNPDETKNYIKLFRKGHYHFYNRIWAMIILQRWYQNHLILLNAK